MESLNTTYSKITAALEAWKKHVSVHAHPSIDDSGRDNIGAEQLAAIFESLHISSANTFLDSLDTLVVTFWSLDHPFDDFDETSLPVLQDFNPLRKIHVSLLFTDIIPCFKFFDTADLLEVSKSRLARLQNSYKSSQWSSLRRTNSFPPSRRLSIYTTGDKDLDNTTRHRLAGLSGQSSKFLANVRDLAGIEQRLLHVQDGELILKTSTGPTLQSQRASMVEVTSKRLSTNSSRRESPSIHTPLSPIIASGEFGLQNSEKCTLDVVTKAGSLDKLIDLLIIGIEDFSSYLQTKELHINIEPSSVVLRMDMESYTSTFLATYKSFFNSKQLLLSLKHRMENARYASSRLLTDSHFPDWTPRETLDPETVEWSLCAKIQFGILEIVSTWISQFMKDFRDFKQIQLDFKAFIEAAEIELKHWETLAAHKSELAVFNSQFKVLLRQVNQAYLRRLYRPLTSQITSSAPRLSSMLPHMNATDSELHEWLNHTHQYIFSQFAQVDIQDWMYTFHVFEIQSMEENAFDFLPSRALSDDVVIINVLHMLNQVRYRQTTFTLLEALPPAIVRLCRLHRSLQNEILSHITSGKWSVKERSRLLEHYVDLVKFCQKRMSNFDMYHESAGEDEINNSISGIPSFISNCINGALVAPESRALTAAWHCVSPATPSFSHLNHSESPRSSTSEEPLVPDIGWIFERMLEIACYVPSVTPGNSSLVNFDKQRYIYNFISNFAIVSQLGPDLDSFISLKDSDDHRRDEDVVGLDVLRTRAQYELDQLQLDSIPQQAFSDLVRLELEKQRRDRRYERIAVESKAQRTRDMAGKMGKDAVITPMDRDATRRSSSGTKSRLGVNSFLRAVRPISMVFSSSMSLDQVNTKSYSLAELEANQPSPSIYPESKATSSVKLVNVVVEDMDADEQGPALKIRDNSGSEHILQVTSAEERDQWKKSLLDSAITDQSRLQPLRRTSRFDLRSETKPQGIAKHYILVLISAFKIPLEQLVAKNPSQVPQVAELLMLEVEARGKSHKFMYMTNHVGLAEVGIYRVPGSVSSVKALRMALDAGQNVDLKSPKWMDINAVAGTFKLWLRELPEPLLTFSLYQSFVDSLSNVPESDQVEYVSTLLRRLPQPNYTVAKRLFNHLKL